VQFLIHPGDELPIYRQIMRGITEAIASGQLRAGEKLGSHRELSEQLVVAPLTVKKAYDELEALGFIETQRGRGTFVCSKLPHINKNEQRERVRGAARNLVSQGYLAGMELDEIVEELRSASREMKEK
jgi:GntR family transcriptional regulator